MADGDPKPDPTPGAYVPPTREEWEAAQRSLKNKTEEADRHAKKVQAQEAAQKAAEEEAAKKRGEFERLYQTEAEKAKALEAEVGAFRAEQQAELDALLKDMGDEDKALVSDEGIPLVKRLRLARHLKGKTAQGNPPPPGPGGKRAAEAGQFGGFESMQEWADRDPKGFLEAKRKEGRLR